MSKKQNTDFSCTIEIQSKKGKITDFFFNNKSENTCYFKINITCLFIAPQLLENVVFSEICFTVYLQFINCKITEKKNGENNVLFIFCNFTRKSILRYISVTPADRKFHFFVHVGSQCVANCSWDVTYKMPS